MLVEKSSTSKRTFRITNPICCAESPKNHVSYACFKRIESNNDADRCDAIFDSLRQNI